MIIVLVVVAVTLVVRIVIVADYLCSDCFVAGVGCCTGVVAAANHWRLKGNGGYCIIFFLWLDFASFLDEMLESLQVSNNQPRFPKSVRKSRQPLRDAGYIKANNVFLVNHALLQFRRLFPYLDRMIAFRVP